MTAGVLSSLIASVLIALATWWWRRRSPALRRGRKARSAARRFTRAGLSNFFSSRADYARYREDGSLLGYLRLAKKSIHIASYWMAHGVEMENIAEGLARLVQANRELVVQVAIVNPTGEYCPGLAHYLGLAEQDLRNRAEASLRTMRKARAELGEIDRARFDVRVYQFVPTASFILLDVNEPNGRIQMDIKPFQVNRQASVSMEFSGPASSLYVLFRDSTLRHLDDCVPFDATRHLSVAGHDVGDGR
ncbi:hypothetical protein [Actinophytocola sediminis]